MTHLDRNNDMQTGTFGRSLGVAKGIAKAVSKGAKMPIVREENRTFHSDRHNEDHR